MGSILLTWKNDITRSDVQPYLNGESSREMFSEKVRHASYELPKLFRTF